MNNIAAGIIITIISFKLENDVLRELIRYLNIKRVGSLCRPKNCNAKHFLHDAFWKFCEAAFGCV